MILPKNKFNHIFKVLTHICKNELELKEFITNNQFIDLLILLEIL